MDVGPPARVQRWLNGEEASSADREFVDDLGHALAAPATLHETLVCYRGSADGRRRRIAEFDRQGTLLAAWRWVPGGLRAAWWRLPDRSWLRLEPAATRDAPWGMSDRLWHAPHLAADGRALTVFEALQYDRVDRIPTLAEPARLPPGGGSVVLNALAALALDQGVPALTYRGSYPSEQLFLTLLESFRYEKHADPLAGFIAGDLWWQPAPHDRLFSGDLYIQRRGRIEKVVWRGRAYVRPDWQAVVRHAPRRVRDTGPAAVRCSLWALGDVLDDHLELDADGDAPRILVELPPARAARALPAAVARGVLAIVAATSAAALAPSLGALELRLEWATVPGDLVAIEGDRGHLSFALRDRVTALLRGARTPAERSGLGLAALTEIAHCLGDALRSQAQAQVAARPEVEQRVLLEAGPLADEAAARAITDAVEALLVDAAG